MPRVQLPAPEYPSLAWQLRYMDSLTADIRRWKESYYNAERTEVDDATYVLWWRNLMFLEQRYPQLMREDSPTTRVGTAPAT